MSRKKVLGHVFGIGVILIAIALWQAPHFVYVWWAGPDTGYRSAGLQSGHYERQFPVWSNAHPYVGRVITGGGTLELDFHIGVEEGKAMFFVRRWPFIRYRTRQFESRWFTAYDGGSLQAELPEAGIYEIYLFTMQFQGDVELDWRMTDSGRG